MTWTHYNTHMYTSMLIKTHIHQWQAHFWGSGRLGDAGVPAKVRALEEAVAVNIHRHSSIYCKRKGSGGVPRFSGTKMDGLAPLSV